MCVLRIYIYNKKKSLDDGRIVGGFFTQWEEDARVSRSSREKTEREKSAADTRDSPRSAAIEQHKTPGKSARAKGASRKTRPTEWEAPRARPLNNFFIVRQLYAPYKGERGRLRGQACYSTSASSVSFRRDDDDDETFSH